MGFRFVLQLAKKYWSFTRIIVEGDAIQVINILTQDATYVDCNSIILDCVKLASCFLVCSFPYVERVHNRVAHMVASYACYVKR